MITKHNVHDGAHIELPDGYYLKVEIKPDDDTEAPWERVYLHGPVSDWVRRDKRPGERMLYTDGWSRRYYDFAEAVKLAKRDGWGLAPERQKEFEAKAGRALTKAEVAQQAVVDDFNRLRAWCAGHWWYVGVVVTLHDDSDNEIDERSLWGIESDSGDYLKEVAKDLGNELVKEHGLGGGAVPTPYIWGEESYETRRGCTDAIQAFLADYLSEHDLAPVVRDGKAYQIEVRVRLVGEASP